MNFNDPQHPSSWALRLVRRLPLLFVAAPERIVLNAALMLVGVAGICSHPPGSVLDAWPTWVLVAWCMCLIAGGASVLVGMIQGKTSVERMGYVLIAPACLIYAISVVGVRGISGLPVMLIFLGMTAAKVIRLLISSAQRDMTIEYGQRLDREEGES